MLFAHISSILYYTLYISDLICCSGNTAIYMYEDVLNKSIEIKIIFKFLLGPINATSVNFRLRLVPFFPFCFQKVIMPGIKNICNGYGTPPYIFTCVKFG